MYGLNRTWPDLSNNYKNNRKQNTLDKDVIKKGEDTNNLSNFRDNSCEFIMEKITLVKEDEQVFRKFVNYMIQKLADIVKPQKTVIPNKFLKKKGDKDNSNFSCVVDETTERQVDIDEFY